MNQKTIVMLFISFFLFYNVNTQSSIIELNGNFSYFIGTHEPDSNWNKPDYNDNAWLKDSFAIIGYGWHSTPTIKHITIPKTTTLYLRIKFDGNLYSNGNLNLSAMFDDGFIAYLNGVEIARINVGKVGEKSNYNQTAIRAYENRLFYKYEAPLNGIYLDSTKIKPLIHTGKNILAIEVHNYELNGHDLSFVCYLYNLSNNPFEYNIYNMVYRYYQQVPFVSSKFPIVLIETDSLGIPLVWSDDKRVKAKMSIIDHPKAEKKLTDPISYKSNISIERRGESSAWFPKMSYNIETQDSLGNNLNASLFGMPTENDWVLFSSFADKSLIKNELVFIIGRQMGHYAPRTRFCELFVNGENMGLYYFMEKIKRDKNRVNVAKRDSLTPENGGYIFKYDKPQTRVVQFVYPKANEVTLIEKNYITNYIKNFEKVLKSDKFLDPIEGYKAYINPYSLIDYIIINELSKNCDAYLYSTYFYKDKKGLIQYGPLWDYDLAFGGASWQNGHLTTGWQFNINKSLQIHLMLRDTGLVKTLSKRWWSLRKNLLSNQNIFYLIDSLIDEIYESRIQNYRVWPVIDKYIFGPDHYSYSYDDEIYQIKEWLTKRLVWVDANIDKIYFPLNTPSIYLIQKSIEIEIYPNPFTHKFNLLTKGLQGNYHITIQNIEGKTLVNIPITIQSEEFTNFEVQHPTLLKLKQGMYILILTQQNRIIHYEKIVKH